VRGKVIDRDLNVAPFLELLQRLHAQLKVHGVCGWVRVHVEWYDTADIECWRPEGGAVGKLLLPRA
jgi:hypothetical protein